MTPRQIGILLHYYVNINTTDYKGPIGAENEWEKALEELSALEMLQICTTNSNSSPKWVITERGSAFVKFILNMPLPQPVKVWRVKA
jgi:hypothetical protein